jgi:hypothetical protein
VDSGTRQVSPERLVWLAFDRATGITDGRWARQATDLDVHLVRSVGEVAALCSSGEPLGCVIEFELSDGDNGVKALERLRAQGLRAPAVIVTATPELALASLARSSLSEAVPVFSRAERYERLREWFEQLRMCLAMLA